MPEIKTQHLFTVTLKVENPMQNIGKTPLGDRRIAKVMGGEFKGAKLNGTVLPGGGDWILVRNDGSFQLDVRLVMKTDDDQLIYMTYKGYRHGPASVLERLGRGEDVDPSEYYFRTAPFFETGSQKYDWINRVVCVATGHRRPDGPVYDVFEVI